MSAFPDTGCAFVDVEELEFETVDLPCDREAPLVLRVELHGIVMTIVFACYAHVDDYKQHPERWTIIHGLDVPPMIRRRAA